MLRYTSTTLGLSPLVRRRTEGKMESKYILRSVIQCYLMLSPRTTQNYFPYFQGGASPHSGNQLFCVCIFQVCYPKLAT